MIDPEIGFTSDVIRDPAKFVGRADLVRDCIKALNSPLGLIAVYGKRGVGKSSLLRQIQQMALGDYTLAKKAGIYHEIPKKARTYFTVYYSCDSIIHSGTELLSRLCNDQDSEDGLLRLVPNDGKEIVEFSRTKETSAGADLKVINWGAKGIESSKYARTVKDDVVQTFRNYVSAIITHHVKPRKKDGVLILLDEFDVISDKNGLGSIMKSLSSDYVKFGVCGIGSDLTSLVEDHASVERLLEQGAIHVRPMSMKESIDIVTTAESLFDGKINFDVEIKNRIADIAKGYPYFVQLIGKECVNKANQLQKQTVDNNVFSNVLNEIKSGNAFPTLEASYQRAIGDSVDRQTLLHLLAEQPDDIASYNDDIGKVVLKNTRKDAEAFDIKYIDQLLPRLIDSRYGPVLARIPDRQGLYEFVNPVLRLYVKLRSLPA